MTENATKDVLEFIKLTHQFQNVERTIDLPNRSHRENDAEHSYQLAMVAWYIISKHKLPLDLSLVLKYALAHDLVEAYAGDTFFYSTDPNKDKKKKEREALAQIKIQEQFPDFKDLHHLIKDYEKQTYQEAQFVHALDKLLPIWNIYLNNGETWKKENITLAILVEKKIQKIKKSEVVQKYFDETLKLLEEDKENLFPV